MINFIENVKLDKQDKNSLSIALAHSLEQTLKRNSLLSGLNKRINSKKNLKIRLSWNQKTIGSVYSIFLICYNVFYVMNFIENLKLDKGDEDSSKIQRRGIYILLD